MKYQANYSSTEDEDIKPIYQKDKKFENQSFHNYSDRIFFSWDKVNFTVPLKKRELKQNALGKDMGSTQPKKQVDDMESPMITNGQQNHGHDTIQRYDDGRKKILHNISGYARPRELVAIMGASGSGKTSLLNFLAARLSLSPGASYSGEVKMNGKPMKPNDFGKAGAFVQQDDILIETMNPIEALSFAARLRTSLSPSEIQQKVESIIQSLGLNACKYTRIGGIMLKGISGGERKRTCIGYELITDPKLMLLDEPTSGLDSTTAYKIVRILKKVATQQNLTIISTIHQPSSEIFSMFDRIILMHEGNVVYQAPANEITSYLGSMNIILPKFKNPADFIIRMVQKPTSIRQDLKLEQIAYQYESTQKPRVDEEMLSQLKNYHGIQARLTMIGEGRKVSKCQQFLEIFRRDLLNTARNPRSLRATIFNAIFVGLLNLALYFKVGELDHNDNNTQRMVSNWVGLAFLLVTNNLFPAIFSVVLQMPIQVPVFKREKANKMYGNTTYLFGRVLAGTLCQLTFPLIFGNVVFFGIGIQISVENYLLYLAGQVLMHMCGISIGYFCGVLFDDETSVRTFSNFMIIIFMLSSGGFSNAATFGWVIKVLAYLSPCRYATEIFYRRISAGYPQQEKQLDILGYTFGDFNCFMALIAFIVAFILGAWVTIVLRNRQI